MKEELLMRRCYESTVKDPKVTFDGGPGENHQIKQKAGLGNDVREEQQKNRMIVQSYAFRWTRQKTIDA